jgi:hypothetical protein
MMTTYKNIIRTNILSAMLLLAIASTVSLIGTAFASTENATTIGETDTSATGVLLEKLNPPPLLQN